MLSLRVVVWYFAYGSNMCRARLETRIGGVLSEGLAVLRDHVHAFSKLGSDGTGKGNVEEKSGGEVFGVLYRLTREQFDHLRQHEGGYRCQQVSVGAGTNADPVVAAIFRALRIVRGLKPTREYFGHYRAGLSEHAFPGYYVRALIQQSGIVD